MTGPYVNTLRTDGIRALEAALSQTRQRTLGLMQAWQSAVTDLSVPLSPQMNPPLWEWGHIAWFQEWWTVRNRQRYQGTRSASSGNGFAASLLPHADAFYNSSEVAHDSRWSLALPELQQTQCYMADVQAHSLAHLRAAPDASDEALYFWRLAMQHEAMHNEASVYMAQNLGVALPESVCVGHAQKVGPVVSSRALPIPAQVCTLGHAGPGFAFDNECPAHAVALAAFEIDATAVTWAQYLPFLQETGYALPPHVRLVQGDWQVQVFGHWQAMPMDAPVVHVNAWDAQAWCQWAGRRLPTEAEWTCAANTQGFVWGQVWEWTSSDFAPYPGFVPHPYREYSEPWWQGHRVLKGACRATSQHLVDVRYRNFFVPERRDIFAGFRSVAL
ncbi:selenoneine synthase SenA [Limnohabitans sp. Rim8]|uniref:selenoneine synthase SenA n=1 Tax=Limnohabitans sp. Rim8 TaxID=1100718 RepID=UPI0026323AFB|nr:selenoneine synthase SenA [Limnohabitans sp. Rim8]